MGGVANGNFQLRLLYFMWQVRLIPFYSFSFSLDKKHGKSFEDQRLKRMDHRYDPKYMSL